MTDNSIVNTFDDFLPHPLPVDKVHAPTPKVKSCIRTGLQAFLE